MTKKALIVEGGGMRGAHTCGVLMGLIKEGLHTFDVVSAASAGACTAAYLVSRQFHLYPSIWADHLHGKVFINFRNIRGPKSVMDLDYLIDDLFGIRLPLDLEALRTSPTNFYMVATQCESGQATYFHNHRDPILQSLKASAALPLAYRRPVIIEGCTYLDGGLSDPIPIQKAIDHGCEEIFVVLTRLEGYRKKAPLINLLPRYYQKKYPALAETILKRHEVYNRALSRIEAGDFPARIHIFRPQKKLPVSRLTTKAENIRAAIDQGYRETLSLLQAYGLT